MYCPDRTRVEGNVVSIRGYVEPLEDRENAVGIYVPWIQRPEIRLEEQKRPLGSE